MGLKETSQILDTFLDSKDARNPPTSFVFFVTASYTPYKMLESSCEAHVTHTPFVVLDTPVFGV